MAIKVLKGDKSIVAVGLVQCLAIWDEMSDDEVTIFWAKGSPQVNFHKMSKDDGEGNSYHPVLKVDRFGGNTIKSCWMSDKKINGKFNYTKDTVVSTGMHTGNIGLNRDGDILHIIEPEDQKAASGEASDGLGKAF